MKIEVREVNSTTFNDLFSRLVNASIGSTQINVAKYHPRREKSLNWSGLKG